ncbi:MAG TPA: aminotransferase class I/II-fold pyridoxal phosphate-dependent enzyme [Chitinophagaceae bacterium]|nr:aminotransferase class I/II-fold pyridoxal phosphate-dependent enzyme [Chitinophagaceae bacterium]
MKPDNTAIETIDQIITDGVKKGILHLYTDKDGVNGNVIILKGGKVVNFGSCSYLGLEFDPRVREAAKAAIDNYGTQFSESRAYVSVRLYQELEELLHRLFEAPCVITPTTTLGHIANIPVLITSADAVITDQRVHNSVNTSVKLLAAAGTHIEVLRHNRMDLLEDRIKFLREKHKKIWYLTDGIYSMFGDTAPIDEIYQLMDIYPGFHLYVDDAHGMSIYGKNGRGSVLNNRPFHPKMALGTSLNKAFASGGGVMVYPNKELARKVRTCGSTLITSGPLQPSQLGAAVAAAKIHLTPEIYDMQNELQERIKFTNLVLKKYKLPVVAENNSAVFFIGVHLPKVGYNMVRRMLDAGYYVNLGIFPAVPMKNTGIRFTITRLHTFSQIEQMIRTMAEELPKALKEENVSYEDIYKAFKMPFPEQEAIDKGVASVINQALSLKLYHYKSIHDIDKKEWDELFANKGTFDWRGLQLLENSFQHNELPENNWEFDYVVIKNLVTGQPVVAGFLTTAMWKDDMLSPASVSENVEIKRSDDPYYFTSKVISTGSLLTEGEHLFIDRSSPFWKDAMQLFFDHINLLQEKYNTNSIVLRDFQDVDDEFESFLIDNGFFKTAMPDNNIINDLSWSTDEGFYQGLSKNSKIHFKKNIKRYREKYEVCIEQDPVKEEIDHWYSLYGNVKNNSLELNTFTLPKKLFVNIANDPSWEILTLKLTGDDGLKKTVCVVFSHIAGDNYIPMIIGLDYSYNKEYKVYRQALYQLVMRARMLGKKKIHLGFSATVEKKKLGAVVFPTYAFMQIRDSYNAEALATLSLVRQAR